MTRQEALGRLMQGLQSDLQDYDELRGLLERQFEAAVYHRARETGELAQRLEELAATLEGRRQERHKLAALLLGKSATVSISAIGARLPAARRPVFDTAWHKLEELVRDCKRLNVRNCSLMTSQYEIMQRILNADVHTYAPA